MRFMRIAGRVILRVATAAAAAVVIASLAMAILQIKPVIILSGSMEPAIHTGSLVLINTKDKSAEPGDIIAFQRGDIFVTHRAIEVTKEGLLTKGDANDSRDPGIVRRDEILGKTLCSLPKAGFILQVIKGFIT